MEPVEGVVDQGVVSKLQSSLERVEKELQETKERKASLERECVIYQSQLDVSSADSELSIQWNIFGEIHCSVQGWEVPLLHRVFRYQYMYMYLELQP